MDRVAFVARSNRRRLFLVYLVAYMRDYAALAVLGSWLAFLPVMLMQRTPPPFALAPRAGAALGVVSAAIGAYGPS